jgi:hypothetical protein
MVFESIRLYVGEVWNDSKEALSYLSKWGLLLAFIALIAVIISTVQLGLFESRLYLSFWPAAHTVPSDLNAAIHNNTLYYSTSDLSSAWPATFSPVTLSSTETREYEVGIFCCGLFLWVSLFFGLAIDAHLAQKEALGAPSRSYRWKWKGLAFVLGIIKFGISCTWSVLQQSILVNEQMGISCREVGGGNILLLIGCCALLSIFFVILPLICPGKECPSLTGKPLTRTGFVWTMTAFFAAIILISLLIYAVNNFRAIVAIQVVTFHAVENVFRIGYQLLA